MLSYVFMSISIFKAASWSYKYSSSNARVKPNPRGRGGFHNLLLLSVKPLILPDNSYILRLARGQHVLITDSEHDPWKHTLIPVWGGGGVSFGLLPAGVWWVNSGSDSGWWSTVFSGLQRIRSSGEQSWRVGDYLNPSPCFTPSNSTLQIQTKAQGLWASGPWRAANPIPAGQQSVWPVAPVGL